MFQITKQIISILGLVYPLPFLSCRVDPDLSSDSEDELDLSAVSKGKHDLLVKAETKSHPGFFKSSKKQFPLFPFFEEKIKYDEYGELIR